MTGGLEIVMGGGSGRHCPGTREFVGRGCLLGPRGGCLPGPQVRFGAADEARRECFPSGEGRAYCRGCDFSLQGDRRARWFMLVLIVTNISTHVVTHIYFTQSNTNA